VETGRMYATVRKDGKADRFVEAQVRRPTGEIRNCGSRGRSLQCAIY
jgi:hypothetical protein